MKGQKIENKEMLRRKCHNTIASLVMAGAECTLRDELRHFGPGVSSSGSLFAEGRHAMEAVLASEVMGDQQPVVEMAREMVSDFIDKMMRKAKASELKLQGCTNEVHCTDGVYVMTVSRLYRDENDAVVVEYSDHVAEGVTPETFYGDYLTEGFTFDEMADIAACLSAKKYEIVK